MLQKTIGQRNNRGAIETLASGISGLARCCVLVWTGGTVGFDSPQPCPNQLLPASGSNRLREMPSGMSRGQDCKPAVILALRSKESKGQDNLFELLDVCQAIRKRPQFVTYCQGG